MAKLICEAWFSTAPPPPFLFSQWTLVSCTAALWLNISLRGCWTPSLTGLSATKAAWVETCVLTASVRYYKVTLLPLSSLRWKFSKLCSLISIFSCWRSCWDPQLYFLGTSLKICIIYSACCMFSQTNVLWMFDILYEIAFPGGKQSLSPTMPSCLWPLPWDKMTIHALSPD